MKILYVHRVWWVLHIRPFRVNQLFLENWTTVAMATTRSRCIVSHICLYLHCAWAAFLSAYFQKMKWGLSNRQSVCLSHTNDFWTAC
jgi:hypothetical protein